MWTDERAETGRDDHTTMPEMRRRRFDLSLDGGAADAADLSTECEGE